MHRFINNWKHLEGFSVEIIASKDKSSLRNSRSVIIYSHSSADDIESWLKFLQPDIFSVQNPTQIWIVSACRGYANVQLHLLRRSEVWAWTPADIGYSTTAKLRLAGEPESKAARQSTHCHRAERGNKVGSWEITAVHKPSAWFASEISLSALIHQRDRWFGLGAWPEPILVFISLRIH